jgi:Glycosyltransferase (GlcNAc)
MMQRRAKPAGGGASNGAAGGGTITIQQMPVLLKRKKKSSNSRSNGGGGGALSEGVFVLLTALAVVFLLAISGGLVYEYKLHHSSSLSLAAVGAVGGGGGAAAAGGGGGGSAAAGGGGGGGAVVSSNAGSKNTVRKAAAEQQQEQPQQQQEQQQEQQQQQQPIVVPVLPIFAPIPDAERYKRQTLDENKPSMAGIVAILQDFIAQLHNVNQHQLQQASAMEICKTVLDLTQQHLGRLDEAYRNRTSDGHNNVPIFPIRHDESIFMSLAAFREDLLADTMRFAFDNAQQPDKLFVGAVVQNCFGKVLPDGVTIDTTGLPCRTGVQVVGRNEQTGKDMTKVSDAPPDRNGIDEFCNMPNYAHYCQNGQVRVLYVHEMDSSGPAMARYFASKLWGGETYFLQTDSHLMFAEHWDEKYRLEVQAASSFPKAVLSSYPPGFPSNAERDPEHAKVQETPGARLCTCSTRLDDPNPIIRINTGVGYSMHNGELPPRPSQIPFIAGMFMKQQHAIRRQLLPRLVSLALSHMCTPSLTIRVTFVFLFLFWQRAFSLHEQNSSWTFRLILSCLGT